MEDHKSQKMEDVKRSDDGVHIAKTEADLPEFFIKKLKKNP